jgi:taurine dioxygenase
MGDGVTIERLDAPLGARVRGLNGKRLLRAETVLALKRALHDHHVLIFEGQDLSEDEFKTFATHFGSIFQNPPGVPVLASDNGVGVAPDVVRVSNVDGYTGSGELAPHADHHWTPYPSSGSLLYAIELPAQGGDTTFTNLNLVYETLPEATKQRIAELRLITYNPFLRKEGDPRPSYRAPDAPLISPVFPHPLVRTHPESGKKVLFLGQRTEVELVGLPYEEGKALIEELRAHLVAERFRYTHRWTVGDVVYWDNQAVLHARSAFDPSARRVMKRVSLAGARPY